LQPSVLPIPVLLLEPDRWRFRGIEAVLKESGRFRIVGERDYGKILILDAPPSAMRPRVAVMAHSLIADHGLSVVAQVADVFRGIAVLVYGYEHTLEATARLIAAGASGLFDLSGPDEYLCDAIAAVAAGRMWAPDEAVKALSQRLSEDDDEPPSRQTPDRPDDQDLLILRYLHEGRSLDEIAASMRVARVTVQARLERLYRAYGVSTPEELVEAALQNAVVI